ncbi:MAG: serine/threonine-protein kinase, partial [Oscillospiraceae bacterium]|nr:serine/threonine-protein kinase [Oscillospiraceae bacterium]
QWKTEIYIEDHQKERHWIEIPGMYSVPTAGNLEWIYRNPSAIWNQISQKYDTSGFARFVTDGVYSHEFCKDSLHPTIRQQAQDFPVAQQQFQATCGPFVAPPQVTKTVYGPNGTQYTTIKELGKGSFGECYDAKDNCGRIVCLKRIQFHNEQEILDPLKKESKMLRKVGEIARERNLGHKESLPGFYDDFTYGDSYYIVMEKINGMDLEKWINEAKAQTPQLESPLMLRNKSDLKNTLYLLANMAYDVACLHSKGLIHRDIKPQNIIYEETKKHLSLIDFGISRILDSNGLADTQVGTPYYAAPEILKRESYSYGTDVWALGLVVSEVLGDGNKPFGNDYLEFSQNVLSSDPSMIHLRRKLYALSINDQIQNDLENLISQALSKTPQQRPTAWNFYLKLNEIAQRIQT